MMFTPLELPQRSYPLQALSYLNPRMNLSTSDKVTLEKLQKGYKGEMSFAKILNKKVTIDCLILSDLRLKFNQTEFQIDSLVITKHTVYLFEVKNFSGDFYVKDDRWYVVDSKKEVRNPTHQLKRTTLLFQQLLQEVAYDLSIKSCLVFINDQFMLYQAPFDRSLIFLSQLQRFIKQLNHNKSRLTSDHHELAKQLKKRHIQISTHMDLPDYNYETLKKGMICSLCFGFLSAAKHKTSFHCDACNVDIDAEEAIIASVNEFNLLFPNKKITVANIYDWCRIVSSKFVIRRTLIKNMKLVKNGRYSYYVYK